MLRKYSKTIRQTTHYTSRPRVSRHLHDLTNNKEVEDKNIQSKTLYECIKQYENQINTKIETL